jgi:hypothetical protein
MRIAALLFCFLLLFSAYAFGMMNHASMTNSKCLRTMYETRLSNNVILEEYPNEIMFAIMRNISLSDCAAFTATCKGLRHKHWFPGIADINPDHIRKNSAFRNNLRQTAYATALVAGTYGPFALSTSICKLIPDDYEYSKEIKNTFSVTGILGTVCFLVSHVMLEWLPKIKYAHQEEDQRTTVTKTNTYLTNAYHTLAKRMNAKRIMPQALKIHYHNNKQVQPLLRAAKKCGIADLTIYFCKVDHYGDVPCRGDFESDNLDLSHLLTDNTKLKNLTIKGDYYFKDNIPLLFAQFHEGLKKNSHLTRVTLDNCCDDAACHIINITNTTKSVTELTIVHSSSYPIPRSTNKKLNCFLHNTTLNKLTLIGCTFDDESTVALQGFMKYNTNLKLLHIKQLGHLYREYELSDQSKKLLQDSPFKPKELIIE